MGFWEENKKLCLSLLAALVVLVVLWPSFKGERPGIIIPWKKDYARLEEKEKDQAEKIRKYYNKKNQLMSKVTAQAKQYNSELEQQYREMRNHGIFIPPWPFRIAPEDGQPGLTFFQIQTKAHTRDLLQYTSLRNVAVSDKYHGLDQHGAPPDKKEKRQLLLRQSAMIDDLVRKATDCGVRSIDRVIHFEPIEAGPLNKAHFLRMYPVRMHIGAPVEAIMKFMNGIEGYHGKVTPIRVDRSQENGKTISETVIRIDVGTKDGLTDQHATTFTIFDEQSDKEDGLRYKGRATVTQVNKDHCIAVVSEETLNDIWDTEEREKRKIAEGDLATTNFYTLIDLKIQGAAPREKNSLTKDIAAVITVGALGLLEEAKTYDPAAARKAKSGKRPPKATWGGY
ncbi:MAG: hypothetical protein HQ592_07525 [Planctomycetes bacterium]|nr:hypothetical protein [Planctomycetota bacterium]